MEKVVYILGAGFSAHTGIPLMNNFILKSKDIYSTGLSKYSYFEKIFNKIEELAKVKNFFKADLYNIEEVLSLFETEAILYRNTKFRVEFIRFISDVIDYYTFKDLEINLGMSNWEESFLGKKVPSNYAFFAMCLMGVSFNACKTGNVNKDDLVLKRIKNENCRYSIISLNYDLILENCIKSINNYYNPDIYLGFEKETYIKDWGNPHLCKLHGSIDTQNIIPPTWSKNTTENSIQRTWKNAYNILKDATQIRIIGYSLPITDNNVRFLLKSAMLKNQSLKKIDVICLDKNSNIKYIYDEFIDFNYYDFKNDRLENYLSAIKNLKRNNNQIAIYDMEKLHKDFMNLD